MRFRLLVLGALALSALAPGGAGATGFTFYPNSEMSCDTSIDGPLSSCGAGTEPVARMAPDGTIFVTSQDGTPAGVNLWRRDSGTWAYTQLQKPDSVPVVSQPSGTTGGGGDNDLAVSLPDPALNGRYHVYVASLNPLLTAEVAVSNDRGASWFLNPVATSYAGVDRPWIAASSVNPQNAFLAFHNSNKEILLTESTNAGITWSAPELMTVGDNTTGASSGIGGSNWQGPLIALPGGGVATAFVEGDANGHLTQLWIATAAEDGSNVQDHFVGTLNPTASGIFPGIAADSAGDLYVAATTQHGVYLASSTDGGSTWSALNSVSASGPPESSGTTVFPTVTAGSAGQVAVAWLGSAATDGITNSAATWNVFIGYSSDATAASPAFTVAQASDHVVHKGVICLNGISCSPLDNSRALAEVLSISHTNDGRVLVAFPDDSDGRHLTGWTWIAEEDLGPGLFANVTPSPEPGPPAGAHSLSTFTQSGTLPLYFTNSNPGAYPNPGVGTQPGYQFDGTTISGALSPSQGSIGHVGLIGYVANDAPGATNPVVFTSSPLATDTYIGGKLNFNLWVQNECGSQSALAQPHINQCASELDFALLDVAPDGSTTPLAGAAVTQGDPVVGGANPTDLDLMWPVSGTGWFLPAGHYLKLSMSFPYVVSSTTRLYYGDDVYPSDIEIPTGTGS